MAWRGEIRPPVPPEEVWVSPKVTLLMSAVVPVTTPSSQLAMAAQVPRLSTFHAQSRPPGICVFKSFIQSLIHLFAGFLNRTFRIDGVFHFFDGFVDMLTGLFRRPLFPAGND